jgi:hypothetical protein
MISVCITQPILNSFAYVLQNKKRFTQFLFLLYLQIAPKYIQGWARPGLIKYEAISKNYLEHLTDRPHCAMTMTACHSALSRLRL